MNFYELLFNRGQPSGEGMTHFERLFAAKFGGSPPPEVREYTGAVPVTITADGTPLIDYLITGNTVQTGTPTPENPVMPQGTGDKTANLFTGQYSQFDNTGGTGTTYAYFKIDEDFTLSFKARNNLTVPQDYYVGISANGGNNSSGVTWTLGSNNTISAGNVRTVKSSTNDYHCFSFYPKNETVFNWLVENFEIMLNSGSTELPYEPFGVKIPISSANTTTPVYLGEVETTRKLGKIDLGTLNWSKTASGNFWAATAIPNIRIINNTSTGNAICDMFKEVPPNNVVNEPYSFSSCLNNVGRPFINKTGFEDLTGEKFKQAMSGVYMYYVLAEPETGIVNEPLMRIGDYADTLSKTQAGVEIPTNNGSTTVDVDTTVKPSEVYIKYMG